jgi:flagella basal body P-ring formation protein FlgA
MTNLKQTFDLTFRIMVLAFALLIGLSFVILGARAALAASLKPTAIVTDSVFTVGDLFSGVGEEASLKILGPAPAPGQDMVLNARTLMRIALALDLQWRPQSSEEQIIVRRKATLIGTEEIRAALIGPLKDKGADGRFDVVFFGVSQPEIILPAEQPSTIEIGEINYDQQSGRFEAEIFAPSRKNALTQVTLVGQAERLLSVPVLANSMARGDIIGAMDIDWVDAVASDLQRDTILDAEKLIGMTPRRLTMSGEALRDADLEKPKLVSRGETVTITYQLGTINLTAKGRALDNGAKDSLIRVVNVSSNQPLEAIVKGQGVVSVVQ